MLFIALCVKIFQDFLEDTGKAMKRTVTLILSFLIGVFGCVISFNTVESRNAPLAKSSAPVVEAVEVTAPVIEEPVEPEEPKEPAIETSLNEKSGFLWPAEIDAEIIAGYPYYSSGGSHMGIDIGIYDESGCNISEGTLILAAKGGEVVEAANDGKWNTGFGNYCIVDHGDGTQTLYAHSSDIHVCVGDSVEQGQILGIIGDTGNTTAPHLHFEVRVENGNGRYKRVNPLKFISEP